VASACDGGHFHSGESNIPSSRAPRSTNHRNLVFDPGGNSFCGTSTSDDHEFSRLFGNKATEADSEAATSSHPSQQTHHSMP
jgi:hypothetical protein